MDLLRGGPLLSKNFRNAIPPLPIAVIYGMLIKKRGGISMFQLKTDFTKNLGPMRPLHGIGNAPTLGNSDMLFHYVEEAGIPFSRLHDMHGLWISPMCSPISTQIPMTLPAMTLPTPIGC